MNKPGSHIDQDTRFCMAVLASKEGRGFGSPAAMNLVHRFKTDRDRLAKELKRLTTRHSEQVRKNIRLEAEILELKAQEDTVE